jgi:hypothetical protein
VNESNTTPIRTVLKNLAGSLKITDAGVDSFINSARVEFPQNTKTVKFYRRFVDRYSAPRGYCDWQKAIRAFCKYVTPRYVLHNLKPYTVKDTGTIENKNCCLCTEQGMHGMTIAVPMLTAAYFKKAPTYFISKKMAIALANTDVPAREVPQKVIDSFFICLPINFFKETLGLDHLGHDCLLIASNEGFRFGQSTANKVFAFESPQMVLEKKDMSDLYFINCGKGALCGSGIDWSEALEKTSPIYLGMPSKGVKAKELPDDRIFPGSAQLKVRNLIKNIILIYNYEKDFLQTDVCSRTIPGKRCKGKRIKAEYPISWIGKNFTRQTVVSGQSHDAGSRRIFKSHWRRGHWHHYWAGAGRKEKILKWVQPVYVKGINLHS